VIVNVRQNKFTYVPRGALAGYNNLALVYLGWGRVSQVHRNAFTDLSNLKLLELSGNKIGETSKDLSKKKFKI
jgi:hypothetical protein